MNVRSNVSATESKRIQIMECAIDLFVSKGFQQTSMAQLSKSSGIAIGTIYHYFKGKAELIEQTYLYVTEQFGKYVMISTSETSLPFKKRFRLVWIRAYTFYVEHPSYFFFKDTLNYSPLISQELKDEGSQYYQASMDLINEGIAQERFANSNPVILTRWIYSSILTLTQITLKELKMNSQIIDDFFEMTWRSIINQDKS